MRLEIIMAYKFQFYSATVPWSVKFLYRNVPIGAFLYKNSTDHGFDNHFDTQQLLKHILSSRTLVANIRVAPLQFSIQISRNLYCLFSVLLPKAV